MTQPEASWPPGNGEMAGRIRAHDWAATSLGPVESWPAMLRATTELLLPHGVPMVVLWGPDLVQVYNDGYRFIMGNKHPTGLGQPTRECWPEVWHINAPIYERVREGETVTFENALYPITRSGQLEDAWFTLTYSPVREAGQIAGVLVTVFETTPQHKQAALREAAEQDARASSQQFQALAMAGTSMIYRMSPDWRVMYRLDGRGVLADTPEPIEDWVALYLPENDLPAIRAAIEEAIRTKAPFALEHRVQQADGGIGWVFSRAIPILDAGGEIREWLGAGADITARKEAEARLRESEERLQVLVAELQHRTRNLMGVVRSIAETTLRASPSLSDFATKFRARLASLARVQGLLSRLSGADRIAFDELIRTELSAVGAAVDDPSRVTLQGPLGIALRSSTVQTFALALHELGTNAAKYGAVKQATGHLAVRWQFQRPGDGDVPWLHVDWHESGVVMPPVGAAPQGGGAGRQLIEKALPYQLKARTTYVMAPDGVRCSISVPVSNRTTVGDNDDDSQLAS